MKVCLSCERLKKQIEELEITINAMRDGYGSEPHEDPWTELDKVLAEYKRDDGSNE